MNNIKWVSGKINKKELQNNRRAYMNSLGRRLNEVISPAGGIAVKLTHVYH
jgi:hypothetical protein